jgi:hypothetical protein
VLFANARGFESDSRLGQHLEQLYSAPELARLLEQGALEFARLLEQVRSLIAGTAPLTPLVRDRADSAHSPANEFRNPKLAGVCYLWLS